MFTSNYDAMINTLATDLTTDEARFEFEAEAHVTVQERYAPERLVISHGEGDYFLMCDLEEVAHVQDLVCVGAEEEDTRFTGSKLDAVAALYRVMHPTSSPCTIMRVGFDACYEAGLLWDRPMKEDTPCTTSAPQNLSRELQTIAVIESVALDMFQSTQDYKLIERQFDTWRRTINTVTPLSQSVQEAFQAVINTARKAQKGELVRYFPGKRVYNAENLLESVQTTYGKWYEATALTGKTYHVRTCTEKGVKSVEIMDPTTGEIKFSCTPEQARSIMSKPRKLA